MPAFCSASAGVRAAATCGTRHSGQGRDARSWQVSSLSCGDARSSENRQSRMPRVPAAAAGCRAGVAVCRSGHLSVGVSRTLAHGFLTGPDRAGMLGPGLSLAGLSLVRPVPVVWSSLAESRQRRPARCGSHARSPYVTYVTAGTGPAIRSCAIGDESAVRERCEFSHRPAGPLCSSSLQMTLRGLALCGCS